MVVTPGQEYFLRFIIRNTTNAQIYVSSTEGYANGHPESTHYGSIAFYEFGENVEDVQATPEPATLALLMPGVLGIAVFRRRRRAGLSA